MRILFGVVGAIVLGVLSFVVVQQSTRADIVQRLKSVEIGLAELSPRGLLGGFAVPASGDSALPPTATIMVRSEGGAWTGNDITIYLGEDLDIRWTSQRATQCTGTVDYSTGGAVSGLQTTVTAPGSGASIVYKVTCTNVAGSATDQLTVTSRNVPAPECSDNINNDDPEDTLIDWDGGGTSLPATYDFATQHPDSAYVPVSNAWKIPHGLMYLLSSNRQGLTWDNYIQNNSTTANKVCEAAGYSIANVTDVRAYDSPDDNYMQKWGGSSWVTVSAEENNAYIYNITCSVPLVPPGLADPDCTGPLDPDEKAGPPTAKLEVKTGTMSYRGRTDTIAVGSDINLKIVAGQQIDLRWSSTDTTSCTSSDFTVTSGAVSGVQSSVTEPTAGNTKTYTVTCTHPTKGSASDFVKVTAVAAALPPTITAEPMIVRYGETTKISWDIGTSDPAECSMSGAGLSDGSLDKPNYFKRLLVSAETVFTISCPLGSDSVTVKVLPRIQES